MKPHYFLLLLLSLYTFSKFFSHSLSSIPRIALQIYCQSFSCMDAPLTSKYSSKSICDSPTVIEKGSNIFPNDRKESSSSQLKKKSILVKASSYMEISIDFDFSILQTCPSGGRTRFDLLTLT